MVTENKNKLLYRKKINQIISLRRNNNIEQFLNNGRDLVFQKYSELNIVEETLDLYQKFLKIKFFLLIKI